MSGTWILDSVALSLYLRADRKMTARFAAALEDDIRVVISAATIVEADHDKVHPARLAWTLSRLTVEPLTKHLARQASDLLKSAGLHGHKYAIDAMVTATAIAVSDKPVTILTSDVDDLVRLLGERLDRSSLEWGADRSKVKVIPV
ncbi:type II toxin-antitoxin system VapC family toxin [Nonomuraea turcica]|uniref:type II toxin-antitoxin system VapC family toxin n=1 Tax=Nonomuraea sp. G32 TaxID=3067274 RepID=UPI00273AD5A9|nr:PIN domain-containing protein [Nonomuraea sp. G32]MDP4506169.1 PIN domain-containing protein [Nonomuraea sp. G32]